MRLQASPAEYRHADDGPADTRTGGDAPIGISVALEGIELYKNITTGEEDLIALNIASLALIGLAVAFPAAWLLFLIASIVIAVFKVLWADTFIDTRLGLTPRRTRR